MYSNIDVLHKAPFPFHDSILSNNHFNNYKFGFNAKCIDINDILVY